MSSINKYLKSSQNYIWNTSLLLGKGATASVYQGMSKHNGESVAVKCFNNVSFGRPYEVQRREYELLTKINHVNIVQLYAIEEENESKINVLIMELCTGGSLYNILDDPVNGYGIEEKEFLLVLEHLTAGMKHITDLKIIHRDLKPGNIMRFISEDGSSVYKLTDFGAARELEDDGKFMSLYGTEEYLHPDLYERAVLRKPAAKSFSAKVDLWSIGVTLYHVATGSLPFRPFGGRKNQQMMHRITTEKESGIISGIQYTENGEVVWSSMLPESCLLCPDLQSKVLPILVGLMECDENRMWTFGKFFETVTHVLSHRPVHVFYVNEVRDYTIYMQPNDSISHLKAIMNCKAHIPVEQQLLIRNKTQLDDDEPILFTSPNEPIILLNSETTCIKAPELIRTPFVDILSVVSSSSSGDQDAQVCKACVSIAYRLYRDSKKFETHYNFINQVPQQIMSLIEGNIKVLNEKKDSCSHLIESLIDQIEYTIETSKNLSKCFPNAKDDGNKNLNDAIVLRKLFHDNLEKNWKDLKPKIIDINNRFEGLSDRWQVDLKSYPNKIQVSKSKAEQLCDRIKESWLFLLKNKSSKAVAGSESQVHKLEKMKVDGNCKKLSKIVFEDSYQALNGIVEHLDDWYNDAHVALVQSSCLHEELNHLMNNRDIVLDYLNTIVEKQHQQWQLLIARSSANINEPDDQILNHSNTLKPDDFTSKIPQANSQIRETIAEDLLQEKMHSICSHTQDELVEEIKSLQETQNLLRISLSENQNLFSELVAMTYTSKSSKV